MTLIGIACHEDRIEVATDHFCMAAFGRYTGTLGKVQTLAHLDAVMAVQGDRKTFGDLSYLALAAELDDFDSLVDYTATLLPDIWRPIERGPNAVTSDTTCYIAGYSPRRDAYVALALSSAHGFAPTELGDVFVFPAPLSEPPAAPATQQEWHDLVVRTHEERSLDVHGTGRKIPTGGRVTLTTIRRHAITQQTLLEFPDNGPSFHRMMQGFNHPSSQLANCPCGSGKVLIECHDAEHSAEPCECGSGRTFGDCCRVDPATKPDDPCPCGRGDLAADCCAPMTWRSQ